MVSMLLCFCRYEHRTTISGGPLLDGDFDLYVPPFVIWCSVFLWLRTRQLNAITADLELFGRR